MKLLAAITEILKREQVEFLSCYPTTPLIDAAAEAGIRPVLCRQERVGVGIADGFSRVSNGRRIGVFTMQAGPGAENAFAGIATAFSDSSPILVLAQGYPRNTSKVVRFFKSAHTYASVTKWVEELNLADRVSEVHRRAFSLLKTGRRGPVMIEIPADAATEEISESLLDYQPVKSRRSAGDPRDVAEAARALVDTKAPVIYAGQGVLYAEASDELVELAELLEAPVMTTLEGKSAFPENHPLSLGIAAIAMSKPAYHFLREAETVFAIGCSLTRYGITAANIPAGKTIIHATNEERDLNKHYAGAYAILGDAKLLLRQLIEAVQDLIGAKGRKGNGSVAKQIKTIKEEWLSEWLPKLTSNEVPINPYRVVWEFTRMVDPGETIVTHESGGSRNHLIPFYQATTPRGYIGWGKSHALGTSLGLIMGAKLAAPEKFCVNFMGDAAFGMTGLDFETSVRCGIPILTIVLNNSSMAAETNTLGISHKLYRTRDIGGNYAEIGRALGGYAEKIEKPEDIAQAIQRARKATQEGRSAFLEFITSQEVSFPRYTL